ncbi:hypothetical protein X975_10120, partial [Stegodyphus mimosarum]
MELSLLCSLSSMIPCHCHMPDYTDFKAVLSICTDRIFSIWLIFLKAKLKNRKMKLLIVNVKCLMMKIMRKRKKMMKKSYVRK